jgi:hypothetical protein
VVYIIARGTSPSDEFKGAVDCRTSVDILDKQGISVFSAIGGESGVKLNCQTNYYENITLKEATPDKQKEELTKIVVSYLRDCWYEFGEGKLDPFASTFGSVERYGFICSRFVIPESFSGNISEDDIRAYVAKNSDPLTKRNYAVFFGGAFPNNSPFLSSVDITVLPFYLGQDYVPIKNISRSDGPDFAVVLYSVQREKLDKIAGQLGLNSDYFGNVNYHVFIVPYNKTKDLDITELAKKSRTG